MIPFIQKLSPSHQAEVSAYITGKRMTQDVFKIFRSDISGNCPFCSQEDSRIHRISQCPHWRQQRIQANISEDKANLLGQNMLQLGLPDLVPLPLRMFLNELEKELPFAIPRHNPAPASCPSLFLDGSAYCNNHPFLTIAGAAVVQGFPASLSCKLIIRSQVFGIGPNSYTAEVFATLLALNHAWEADLYSDCSAAVEQLQYIIESNTLPAIQPGYHHIWSPILEHLEHLEAGQFCGITITKVQAMGQPFQIVLSNFLLLPTNKLTSRQKMFFH